jgi:prolyl oligopeptidase PreP (S9A serine peptidase family)
MIKKTIFIAYTAILTCNLAFASPDESCLLFSISAKNIGRLGVINVSNHSLTVEIKNKNAETFFTKNIAGNKNFFQLVDLNTLPDGEYKVVVSGTNFSSERKFTIENHTAKLIPKETESIPVFNLLENKVLLIRYYNVKQNTVNIFIESDSEVVFEERNITDLNVVKKYSLSKLPKGRYVVKVYSGGIIYDYPLIIN